MSERGKIWFYRILWLSLSVLIFFLPNIIIFFLDKPQIVYDNCYVEYWDSTNTSVCELDITFDKECSGGKAQVGFYDVKGELLETETVYFYESNGVWTSYSVYVDGYADSYEILSVDFAEHEPIYYVRIALIFTCISFLWSLTLVYKEYGYRGGKISVYAGYSTCTLRLNGEIYDEAEKERGLHYCLPVYLEVTLKDGTYIEAHISSGNFIKLKIDGVLYKQKYVKK